MNQSLKDALTGAFGDDVAKKANMKANPGNFFEDFHVGMEMVHATPKTVTEGDVALYTGLTGSRYALFSADRFAQDCGLEGAPVDPLRDHSPARMRCPPFPQPARPPTPSHR